MSKAENTFMEKLAEVVGAVRPHADITSQAHEDVVTQEATEKLASMNMRDIVEHPEFQAGFAARMQERQAEIDKAAASIYNMSMPEAD